MNAEMNDIFLRHTFKLAGEAKRAGNFPYACILVDASGNIILEAKNEIFTGKNNLKHAEIVLLLEACSKYSFEEMNSFSVYASAEPCAMCAAAIYWSGAGRLVFGLSSKRKNQLSLGSSNISMSMSCSDVIGSGNRHMEIIGPLLEEEAAKSHA
jgi:tRNA(Arg) A34 adenosine deaminase TadA